MPPEAERLCEYAAPRKPLGKGEELEIVRFEPAGETKKVKALDVPPPGEGLTTATLTDPAETISLDGICAVN